jgi:hypothetical protein
LGIPFEIVKHIIKVKKEELKEKELERSNKEKKQLILSFIAKKENEKLEGLDLEELKRMAESL